MPIFVFLIFAVLFLISCSVQPADIHDKPYHTHVDFKVYVDDKPLDFSGMMYQVRSQEVHVEDNIGDVVHVHKKGITLGYFLGTLGLDMNDTCITVPVQGTFCNEQGNNVSFYVNGQEKHDFKNYVMQGYDKILLSYGNGSIDLQLDSITDHASMMSMENE